MTSNDSTRSHSVSIWIEAAKNGDEKAGQALFERYFNQLVNLSRTRVQRKRRVEDEEDAAIQAMHSFLAGISDGKYSQVNDRSALWPLLVDIVIKNSKKQLRKQYAAKRNDVAVGGESVFFNASDGNKQIADYAMFEADEYDSIELIEILQKVREQLSDTEREIFELKLQQKSNREIAEILGRPSRTIDRKVSNVILPKLEALLGN